MAIGAGCVRVRGVAIVPCDARARAVEGADDRVAGVCEVGRLCRVERGAEAGVREAAAAPVQEAIRRRGGTRRWEKVSEGDGKGEGRRRGRRRLQSHLLGDEADWNWAWLHVGVCAHAPWQPAHSYLDSAQ